MNIDPTKFTDEELAACARECLSEFKKRQAAGTMKVRCPACNTPLRDWDQYCTSFTQVKLVFQMMEIMVRSGADHVHIKSDLNGVPPEHRDHTQVGRITNHYGKMLYLNLITRCTEDGTALPHFRTDATEDQQEYYEESGGPDCFRPTEEGREFVLGRAPLQPALVRVKNCQIIAEDENKDSVDWVRDVIARSKAAQRAGNEQDWLDKSGAMVMHYPIALDEEEEQLDLFDDNGDDDEAAENSEDDDGGNEESKDEDQDEERPEE